MEERERERKNKLLDRFIHPAFTTTVHTFYELTPCYYIITLNTLERKRERENCTLSDLSSPYNLEERENDAL